MFPIFVQLISTLSRQTMGLLQFRRRNTIRKRSLLDCKILFLLDTRWDPNCDITWNPSLKPDCDILHSLVRSLQIVFEGAIGTQILGLAVELVATRAR